MKNTLLAFVAGSIFSFVLGAHTEEAASQATRRARRVRSF